LSIISLLVDEFILSQEYENQSIILPDKFLPSKEFLEYHHENIFIK
jgi:putative restriction endonuclease